MICQSALWSKRSQVLRVAATDLRVLGIDLYLGTAYVLAALLLLGDAAYGAYLMLLMVITYFGIRVCGPEINAQTAYFYANLPRNRELTFRTHVGLLLTYCVIMETVIAIGIDLQMRAVPSARNIEFNPSLAIQPFVAVALLMYALYHRANTLIKALVVMGFIVVANFFATYTSVSEGQNIGWVGAIFMSTVSALLLWKASEQWKFSQMGESV